MVKTLRLLLLEECNRSCEGCCNKDWDMAAVKTVAMDDYREAEVICLTGGEPMLYPERIASLVSLLKLIGVTAKFILYTAKSKRALDLVAMLHWLDGITLTLHEQYDVPAFELLQLYLLYATDLVASKSLRLNVFSGIDLEGVDTSGWQVKSGIEWIKNCPLPENEIFRKL